MWITLIILAVIIIATWTVVAKKAGSTITDAYNYLNFQSSGFFSWDDSSTSPGWEDTVAEYTDAEILIAIQSHGYQAPYVGGTDSIWGAVDKQSSTWAKVARYQDFGGGAFGAGGFGSGTAWTAVDKDS